MLNKVISHIRANRTQYNVAVVVGIIESVIVWYLVPPQSGSFINFLTSRVPIHGWLVVLLAILMVVFIALLAGFLWPYVKRQITEEVVNKKFPIGSVRLDGRRFIGCEFDESNMMYSGRGAVKMEHCKLRGVRLTLDGPAGSTLNFLATIYHDMDEEGKKHLDAVFEDIRQGRHTKKESHYI
jgi:hypothetical protein